MLFWIMCEDTQSCTCPLDSSPHSILYITDVSVDVLCTCGISSTPVHPRETVLWMSFRFLLFEGLILVGVTTVKLDLSTAWSYDLAQALQASLKAAERINGSLGPCRRSKDQPSLSPTPITVLESIKYASSFLSTDCSIEKEKQMAAISIIFLRPAHKVIVKVTFVKVLMEK